MFEVGVVGAVELDPVWPLGSDEELDWDCLPPIVRSLVQSGGVAFGPGIDLRSVPWADLLETLRGVFHRAPRGRVVRSRHRTNELVPVLWVAAPATPDCTVTASFGRSASAKGELSVTLGPVSGGAGVTCTLSGSDELSASNGEVRRGLLDLPVEKETRMVVPPGGREEFPVSFYWPDLSRPTGFRGEVVPATDVPSAYPGEAATLRSPGGLKGSLAQKVEVEVKFGLGYDNKDKGLSLGATATVQGEIELSGTWELAAGDFRRYWTSSPPGLAIV